MGEFSQTPSLMTSAKSTLRFRRKNACRKGNISSDGNRCRGEIKAHGAIGLRASQTHLSNPVFVLRFAEFIYFFTSAWLGRCHCGNADGFNSTTGIYDTQMDYMRQHRKGVRLRVLYKSSALDAKNGPEIPYLLFVSLTRRRPPQAQFALSFRERLATFTVLLLSNAPNWFVFICQAQRAHLLF